MKKTKSNLKTELFLASGSPRRLELLTNANLKFTKVVFPVHEVMKKGESPRQMVSRLSRSKANAAFRQLVRDSVLKRAIILSADTTVVSPSGYRCLGKPSSAKHAVRLLREISGRTHTVLTGFTILLIEGNRVKRTITKVVQTKVKMKPLSKTELDWYVATGEPMDKAGAYAAQGIGANFIESVNGSYTNVIGLPMVQVLKVIHGIT